MTWLSRCGLMALMSVAAYCAAPAYRARGDEIQYPGQDYAKLDTFEALNIEEADKLFIKRDYTGAYAAYKAYSFEFTKSKALPYVLLRMARCLHLLGKRNEAIRHYQDVVDYFPDAVRYAAAALFHQGECHGQNGETDKQIAVWARMVKDEGYATQPNSGSALAFLAQAMEKLGKFEEAVGYNWRTAVNFQQSNPQAATVARHAVQYHYVVRRPNHEKMKAFYIAANGFGGGNWANVDDPQEDARYWSSILAVVENAQENREEAARYWGAAMGDRFADNDSLRKQWFDVMQIHEKDRAKWTARMEKQFAAKPVSVARVLQWCEYYGVDPKLRAEFFARNGAALAGGLKLAEKLGVMERLRQLRMDEEAKALIRATSLQGLSDEEIRSLVFFAANYQGEEEVVRNLSRIKDPTFAAKCRFDYYSRHLGNNRQLAEKALVEVPVLKKDPKYAGPGLSWSEGELLRWLGRFEEAIKAYQAANRQPDSTWMVAECQVALKQYGEAIKNVQGLEMVGGAVAAQACLKVADIYRVSGDKAREIEQLRLVLRRYPKSGESSAAHQRLEAYGVKLVGGEAKAEE